MVDLCDFSEDAHLNRTNKYSRAQFGLCAFVGDLSRTLLVISLYVNDQNPAALPGATLHYYSPIF